MVCIWSEWLSRLDNKLQLDDLATLTHAKSVKQENHVLPEKLIKQNHDEEEDVVDKHPADFGHLLLEGQVGFDSKVEERDDEWDLESNEDVVAEGSHN